MHKKIPLHGMLRGMPGLAGQARRDAWNALFVTGIGWDTGQL
jgi:hypothetical protein